MQSDSQKHRDEEMQKFISGVLDGLSPSLAQIDEPLTADGLSNTLINYLAGDFMRPAILAILRPYVQAWLDGDKQPETDEAAE
jgi:hypothetical protein